MINVESLIRFISLTFRGNNASVASGIGALWYCFTIFWLYLTTPLLFLIIKKLSVKGQYLCLTIIVVLGLAYRVLGRLFGLEWYTNIYSSIIGNLDLYCCAALIASIYNSKETVSKTKRTIFYIATILLLIFNSFCYFYGETTKPILLSVYRYVCPSL